MDHADLVTEMSQVERLSTQDRLHLARMRRAQQLKVAKQREKEWQKAQKRKDASTINGKNNNRKHIAFEDSVVLLEAAARNDINEVARLLQKGVSPDATNEDGLTALHQCCIDNNSDMLKILLDYGANVNAEDSERWTPLHAAATCGHLFLVKLLIDRGANLLSVNADGNMPYDLCDNEETLDFIEAEMSQRGVTQELIDETRSSTESQMLNDLEIISKCGGDLEAPDIQGATPLHIAAANGYSRAVEYLLEHHVSVDAVDNDLWTPVHAAACWGHLEVLEILVQNGADLKAKNKNDETPADICEDPDIRERIEQLRTEQESKKLAQTIRVRRSQSNNTRAQSVRRTSLRDKTLTTKKDAVEETRLRLQAQEGYNTTDGTTTEPNSITSDNNQMSLRNNTQQQTTSQPSNNVPINNSTNLINNNNNNNNNSNSNNNNNNNNHNNNNNNNNINNNTRYSNSIQQQQQQNSLYGQTTTTTTTATQQPTSTATTNNILSYPNSYETLNRRSPEGKDNDTFITEDKKLIGINNNNSQQKNGGVVGDISTGIFQTSNENGKINVQVTVLVDTQNIDHTIAGTLADLKKHRAQSRTSNSPENGSINNTGQQQPVELSIVSSPELQSPTITMSKFSGITSDVVSDSTRSRKCCSIM